MSWRLTLKRLFCRHRYSDINLTSCSVSGGILLSNHCIKCGKPYTVMMSDRYIDKQIEEDKERMEKDEYFTSK